MKTDINTAIKGKKVNEILLFREMAKAFNYNCISRCTYVEEVHQSRVEYESKIRGNAKTVEIGDLLLITYDISTDELRICFLQAKYRNKTYTKFLDFTANIFQWELLKDKPNLNSSIYPKNILNFRKDYDSLTAFGIFYHDNICGDIDFLFTIPKYIKPKKTLPTTPIKNAIRKFSYECDAGVGSPNPLCTNCKKPDETVCICSIDRFEKEVLSCRVGAPINDFFRPYIINLLKRMENIADDSSVISEIISNLNLDIKYDICNDFNYTFEVDEEGNNYPAAIVVITDSENLDRECILDCEDFSICERCFWTYREVE